MITKINQIDEKIRKNIVKKYKSKKCNVVDLMKNYNLSHNEILAILSDKADTDKLRMDIPTFKMSDEDFIIISDTHICSKLMDLKLMKIVYDFASKNGIKHILHGGDLLQGTSFPVHENIRDGLRQANKCIQVVPRVEDITTHILYGNHDFQAIKNNAYALKAIASRKDFDIIGFHRAYFSWGKNLFSIKHPIEKYKLVIPRFSTECNFYGHRHDFKVDEKGIYLPTLSKDLKEYGEMTKPGWLLVSRDGDKMVVYHFIIDLDYGIHDQGVCYSKKLANSFCVK